MTYVTDPIGDLLTRIRNAQHARKKSCSAPWSRMKEELCAILKEGGWIADYAVIGEAPKQDIELTFATDKPKLELRRVSKPGQRIYTGSADLRPVLQGFGVAILTTSQGLMTDKQAKQKKIGGEVLCTVS